MFEEKLAEKAQYDQQLVEFVNLYARFRQDIVDPAADRVRIAKFEIRIDNAWRTLPQDKRDLIVAALLSKNMLPEEVGLAIKHLKAKVIKLN